MRGLRAEERHMRRSAGKASRLPWRRLRFALTEPAANKILHRLRLPRLVSAIVAVFHLLL